MNLALEAVLKDLKKNLNTHIENIEWHTRKLKESETLKSATISVIEKLESDTPFPNVITVEKVSEEIPKHKKSLLSKFWELFK